jgi:hypothetical protein
VSVNDSTAAERPNLAPALVHRARGAVIVWVFVTVLALVAANAAPEHVLQILYAHLIASAVLALWTLVRTIGAALPTWGETGFDRAFQTQSKSSTAPDELEAVRRTIMFARFTALDAHARLGPLLREIADAHLVARYGRGLDAKPEWVRAHLGPSLWDAIQPPEKPPEPQAPGLDVAQLSAIVVELESLAQS